MADTNGHLRQVQELRDKIRSQQIQALQGLLADWKESHPHLRELLLGLDMEGTQGLKTSLSFQRGPFSVRSVIARPDLGYIAQIEDKSFHTLLDIWENCLQTGTMPWTEDYSQVKKLRQRLRVD